MPPEPNAGMHDLATEQRNLLTANIDCLSPLEIIHQINAEDAKVAQAVEGEAAQIAAAVEQIADRLRNGGRLIYIGAGTSGRLGVLDASECPPTFSTPPGLVVGWIAGGPDALTHSAEKVEDDAEAGRADAEQLRIGERDAVVGITASGRTPYVLGAIAAANERGALTIGLACNRDSALAKMVKIMIAPVVGPEVIAGSTRLKAGTAQKMVLNMLSTGTMILLGKTFGNLMVDLKATNSKLQQRVIRNIQAATDLDEHKAAAILQAAGGEGKTAIVAALAGLEPTEARAKLEAAGGSVRAALDGVAPCPE